MLSIEFLQTKIAGNSLQTWLITFTIALIVFLVAGIIRYHSGKQLARLVERNGVMIWPIAGCMNRESAIRNPANRYRRYPGCFVLLFCSYNK